MADDPQNTAPQDAQPEPAQPTPEPPPPPPSEAAAGAAAPGDQPAVEQPSLNAADAADVPPSEPASSTPLPPDAPPPDSAVQTAADDVGFSQDDIDALMAAAGGGESPEAGGQGEEFTGFSQADIDAAIQGVSGSQSTGSPAGSSPARSSPQNEIDAMLAAAGTGGAAADARLDSAGRPFDEAAAAMAAAIAEESAAKPRPGASAGKRPAADLPAPKPLDLPDFSMADAEAIHDISILRDVNLRVQIELGKTRMYIDDVLRLSEGSVVELDNLAGDPVDVIVNGRLIARGEVLVLSDNFCVRICEIIEGPQNMAVA